ncbi:SDR family NAD(P)-dependent oxidoreductase [SAR86 cluster bacterium]|jgi:NAD(P)-dependent dehydrogenase (short-subunit alcohol dehydrogenase family)|nr:SDR family NAD(P)-dependent oxidoreductase [SAR86 cluster bacterium]|tara:strand:+ start:1431 stop:2333 length:903 start_codon:yes stop_codon:yes gene_type:complete
MTILKDKVAIITGAGRGIGKETALFLAKQGVKILVNDLGANPDGSGEDKIADEVVSEITNLGGKALANYDSVDSFEGGQNIFNSALSEFGAVDILINNAGILRDKTLFNMEESDWDIIMAVHLKGHFNCTKPFVCYIRETNRLNCRVINMSSVSGLIGNFGQTNYGAAKAGIAGFSRSLSMEMAKYKCTVNTISPGAATRLTIDLMKAAGRDVDENDWKQGPQQIAPVIAWLSSDEANEITNQIFHISQGNVGIMQQPAVIKSFKSDTVWDLEKLNRVMPDLIDAKKIHDEEVEKKGEPI